MERRVLPPIGDLFLDSLLAKDTTATEIEYNRQFATYSLYFRSNSIIYNIKMKFSAVVLSLALAASQTTAFMAPAPVARTSAGPMFSSEMAEETAATTTTTEDAPGT